MAKIIKKTDYSCPFGNFFYIDSLRILIEVSAFKEVRIPEKFAIYAEDFDGLLIAEVKKKIFPLLFPNASEEQKSYVGKQIKEVKGKYGKMTKYEDVMIYLTAKSNPVNYFNGVDRNTLMRVLQEMKRRGFVKYDNIDDVIQRIRIKDVDITINQCSEKSREEIKKQFKKTYDYISPQYKHLVEAYKDKKNKKNMGLEFSKRGKMYYFKIYYKTDEIRPYLHEINMTDAQRIYLESLRPLLRYEFTLRDDYDFNKFFGIKNNIVDLWKILEDREKVLRVLQQYYMHYRINNEKIVKIVNSEKKLPMNDDIIIGLVNLLKEFNVSYDTIYHTIVERTPNMKKLQGNILTPAQRKMKQRYREKARKILEYFELSEKDISIFEKNFNDYKETFRLLFEE